MDKPIAIQSGFEADAPVMLYAGTDAITIPLAFYAVLWPEWWRSQQQNYYTNGYPGWRQQPNLAADARGENGAVR